MPARAPKHRPLGSKGPAHVPSVAVRMKTAERGYGSRWQKARATFLKRSPLCVECQRKGFVTLARIVDHLIPHKGNQALFWDTSNWQPLCKSCHDVKTATEDGGFGRAPRSGART